MHIGFPEHRKVFYYEKIALRRGGRGGRGERRRGDSGRHHPSSRTIRVQEEEN